MKNKVMYDKESWSIIMNGSQIYSDTQIMIMVVLGLIQDLTMVIEKTKNPEHIKQLTVNRGKCVQRLISNYNILLCLEWLDDKLEGNLLSEIIF